MKIYLCDFCKQHIKSGRITSDLNGLTDLCPDCHNGILNLKKIVERQGKEVLKQLAVIANKEPLQ